MSLQAILLLAAGIGLDAWFTAMNQLLVSLDLRPLTEKAEEGDPTATTLLSYLAQRDRLLGVTVTGATFATMLSSVAVWQLLVPSVGWELAAISGLPAVWGLALLGESLPRAWAHTLPWQGAAVWLVPLHFFSQIFAPAVWLVQAGSRAFSRAFQSPEGLHAFVSREELRELLVEGAANDVKPHERQMLKRVLDFHDLKVVDVLVPLEKVTRVDENTSLAEAAEQFALAGHSRLPVCNRRSGQVVGVLHAHDVLYAPQLDAPTRSLMRSCRYLPDSAPLDRVLAEMQRSHLGRAMVVNQQGMVTGLITLEDILEQIVGDIRDEFD